MLLVLLSALVRLACCAARDRRSESAHGRAAPSADHRGEPAVNRSHQTCQSIIRTTGGDRDRDRQIHHTSPRDSKLCFNFLLQHHSEQPCEAICWSYRDETEPRRGGAHQEQVCNPGKARLQRERDHQAETERAQEALPPPSDRATNPGFCGSSPTPQLAGVRGGETTSRPPRPTVNSQNQAHLFPKCWALRTDHDEERDVAGPPTSQGRAVERGRRRCTRTGQAGKRPWRGWASEASGRGTAVSRLAQRVRRGCSAVRRAIG